MRPRFLNRRIRNPQPDINLILRDLPFYLAQYTFANKDAEEAVKRDLNPKLYHQDFIDKPYLDTNDFFSSLEKPTISPIAFAIYKNIPVKIFTGQRIRKDKIQFQLEKILKSNIKSREATSAAVKVFYISQLFHPIEPLTPETEDFSYYGDDLNDEDWADIYSEVVEAGFPDAPTILKNIRIQQFSYKSTAYLDLQINMRGSSDPAKQQIIKLVELIKKIADEYGIHPTVIALRIFADPDFGKLATIAIEHRKEHHRLQQQKIQEEESKIQRRLEEEVLAEEYAKELENLRASVKPEHIEEFPEAIPSPSPSLKQYRIFIVGGEDFNIPTWIKNSFIIRHATGTISGERAMQILGSEIPDLILVLRFVSHGTSTPVTDFARKHGVPILLAKPSISSAVKQAAIYGPAWFAAAYPKSLRKY